MDRNPLEQDSEKLYYQFKHQFLGYEYYEISHQGNRLVHNMYDTVVCL